METGTSGLLVITNFATIWKCWSSGITKLQEGLHKLFEHLFGDVQKHARADNEEKLWSTLIRVVVVVEVVEDIYTETSMFLSIGASVQGYPFESFDEVTLVMSQPIVLLTYNKATVLWFVIMVIYFFQSQRFAI